MLIKNYTRKKYRRHPPTPRFVRTPSLFSFPLNSTYIAPLYPTYGTLCSSSPLGPLNGSATRQASQTSGIHYSCRPTPLDGWNTENCSETNSSGATPYSPTPSLVDVLHTRPRETRRGARLIGTVRFFPQQFLRLKMIVAGVVYVMRVEILPKFFRAFFFGFRRNGS